MAIRSIPFEAISARDVESLKDREVREDRTLDFKRDLNLEGRDSKSEILKDVASAPGVPGV